MSESNRPPEPEPVTSPASLTGLSLLLVILTLATYWQTAGFEFINLDDPQYVFLNERLQDGLSFGDVTWAFTTTYLANWMPLTWLSYFLDYALFEFAPGGYHVTNLVLHVLATLALLAFLFHATRRTWPSFTVAALFALHPLHVESVAWIAERKDVLSALFGFAALLAYSHYVRAPSATRLAGVFVLFALGLMAKSMLVTLPVLFLLLDYWPFRRIRFENRQVALGDLGRLFREKAPFLVASVIVAGVTIYAQRTGGGLRTFQEMALPVRLANAATAYVLYLRDTVWPTGLAAYYPFPDRDRLFGLGIAAAAFVCIVTAVALRWYRRAPYVVTGWLWYLVTLLPVIGVIQVGGQGRADRYTYVPLVGIFIIVVWVFESVRLPSLRLARWPATAAILLFMLPLTWVQVGYWCDSETLFRRAIAVTNENAIAYAQLGQALLTKGDLAGAQDQLEQAVAISPNFSFAWRVLGHVHFERGALVESVDCYRRSLASLRGDQHKPRANSYAGLGAAQLELNDLDGAMESLSEAVRLDPQHADALANLGALYLIHGKARVALPYLEAALERTPDDPVVLTNLAYAHSLTGDSVEARRLIARVLQNDPGYTKAISLRNYLDTEASRPAAEP